MGWRFIKSFKVLPGVRLNLSRSGLSATIGGAPISVNVGPRGTYGTVSVPGTGVSFRHRISGSSDKPAVPTPSPNLHDALPNPQPTIGPIPENILPATQARTEVRSSSTESLNSQSFREFRSLLQQAYQERTSLETELSAAMNDLNVATKRYSSWDRGFLFKRLFPKSFEERKEAFQLAKDKATELSEQLRLTRLAAHFDIEREQAEPYYRMRDEFSALCGCKAIWDTLTRESLNRFATRSAATEAITRKLVQFRLAECDILAWEQRVPHLQNQNGGDLFLYPGFVIYRASKQAFALIDSQEVKLEYRPMRFIESETVPSDSQVVGQAWAKSNKDGSRDKRFAGNYQIPIALYGQLTFSSPSGLNEEFQFSNPELAQKFAEAWQRFQQSFASLPRAVGVQ